MFPRRADGAFGELWAGSWCLRAMRHTLILGLFLVGGCGATARVATPERNVEETRIVARATEGGEYAFEAYTAEELFRDANILVRDGGCDEAVLRYDRLADEFPSSRFVSPALYNAGLCLMQGGEFVEAATRFQRLLRELPESSDVKHATLELAGLEIELERFEEALTSAEALLARTDLSESERLESLARRAQALFGLARIDDAEAAARSGIAYYRVHREELPDEFFAACSSYVLAETIRARAEAITLPVADALTQHEYLERRAQFILDAQRQYYDTIRLTDAHWAAAAGYRIGSMYESLFHLIMTAPTPPPAHDLSPEGLVLYEAQFREELAERVRPLVRHAIHYWELTLMMVERTGVRTAWADRTRADLEHARGLLLGTLLPDAIEREGAGTELADPRPHPASPSE